MNDNEVVIIGGDHYNALGVIRAFGENGIKPYLFVISDTKYISIIKSKYVNKYWICNNEEEAILKICDVFRENDKKIVIIPTSDKAASMLDLNYDKLPKNFIIQNINNKSKQINKYMNKYEQYLLSKKYGINMANSQILSFPFNIELISNNIKFPLIIKPLLSICGKKEDISIIYNEGDLKKQLNYYNENSYNDVLIQEFLEIDYECDMSGYCYNKNVAIAGYIKKERIWPLGRGSMTFGCVCNYDKFKTEIAKIEKIIIDLNYNGMFDVEFFVKDDKVYLNEINFRNSGLTYLYNSSYLCYYYYLSCINKKFIECPKITNGYYVMNEYAEFHQIIDKNISVNKYLSDRHKCSSLLIYNKDDKKPSRYMLINKIRKYFKK